MRAFLLFLALANILFYVWASDENAALFGRKLPREPGRLAAQIEPERLRVLRPAGASVSAPSAAAPQTVAAAEAQAVCRRITGLKAEQTAEVRQAIARAATGVTVGSREVVEPASWFVHVPSDADKRTPAARAAELRGQGVRDFFIVQSGRYRNAISLGVFKVQAAANDQLQTLQRRGVKLARVGVWDEERRAVFELGGTSASVASAVAEVERRYPGAESGECRN